MTSEYIPRLARPEAGGQDLVFAHRCYMFWLLPVLFIGALKHYNLAVL
jgi:hypothetical protein